jgi:O-antigen/teichoic acid export membrane protein
MSTIEAPSEEQPIASAVKPEKSSLGHVLFSGASALGMATLTERGLGFVANLAAAKVGGAQVFGAYSVALTTANNIASYAGAGIGTTANRFSGEYPYGQPGYRGLLRWLAVFSAGSALLAVAVLWLAAGPIALHLLRNPALTPLLQLAAISSGAIILLECLRGLLVGQRRFAALMALSILFGGGMAVVLPLAARRGASAITEGQASVAFGTILLCLIFAGWLRFAPTGAGKLGQGPQPGRILRFGAMQLGSMVGLNAAGWWIASLVARADLTLVQMGCYAVAMQMRNVCGMPPLLISQMAYAQMTEEGGQNFGGPNRVTILSTLTVTVFSLLITGAVAALLPWVMPVLYGKSFAGAELAVTLALATGLIHMSGVPAAFRLTVVSLPATGYINGVWTVFIFALGTWVVPKGGAAPAAATFLGAHVLSALLTLVVLLRMRAASGELLTMSMPAFAGAILLAGLGWLRASSPDKALLSGLMIVSSGLLIWVSFLLARRTGALTPDFSVVRFVTRMLLKAPFARRFAKVGFAGGEVEQ